MPSKTQGFGGAVVLGITAVITKLPPLTPANVNPTLTYVSPTQKTLSSPTTSLLKLAHSTALPDYTTLKMDTFKGFGKSFRYVRNPSNIFVCPKKLPGSLRLRSRP